LFARTTHSYSSFWCWTHRVSKCFDRQLHPYAKQ
jgi:hypothetical protein